MAEKTKLEAVPDAVGPGPPHGVPDTAQERIAVLERQLAGARQELAAKAREVDVVQRTVADVHEAIETIDAGFAMFDRNDRLVFCNQQYYATFPELTADDIIRPGVAFEEIVRKGAERGLVEAAVGRVEAYIKERMEKHRYPGDPYEYRQKGGTWIRTEERRTPGGTYVGTRTNITQFKQIEQKLAKLLAEQKAHLSAFAQYAPVSFMVKDRKSRFTYVNTHFEQLFGVRNSDVLGRTMAELRPGADLSIAIAQEEEVWKTGVASAVEMDMVANGGSVRRLEVRKFPIFGPGDEMIALGGINLDITEIKNAQNEMAYARDQAEAGNRAKSEFLAAMSHELRTPLTSSLGSLGLLNGLMSDFLPDQGKELLEIALRNNNTLLHLVNELLDFEKVLSGTLVIETQAHDIRALTSTIIHDLQGYARTQSVKFIFKAPDDPLFAQVNEHRFGQILGNLLSNAAKFSDAGRDVGIDLTCHGGRVQVNVRDQGPGIPEDFQNKLYEQFTQVDSSSSRQHRGTGLGLTISKALTERMGGELSFDTEIGVGTTFHISFPQLTISLSPAA
ncbi:MAG: PAS-domain containing protein [Rhodospirillales bacterium]|nr:PAS-domain containing protein [Rhodospirillales bacterium]